MNRGNQFDLECLQREHCKGLNPKAQVKVTKTKTKKTKDKNRKVGDLVFF